MYRDIRHVLRGQCLSCSCTSFMSIFGRVICDYCGCPPAQHQPVCQNQLFFQQQEEFQQKSYEAMMALDERDNMEESLDLSFYRNVVHHKFVKPTTG